MSKKRIEFSKSAKEFMFEHGKWSGTKNVRALVEKGDMKRAQLMAWMCWLYLYPVSRPDVLDKGGVSSAERATIETEVASLRALLVDLGVDPDGRQVSA